MIWTLLPSRSKLFKKIQKKVLLGLLVKRIFIFVPYNGHQDKNWLLSLTLIEKEVGHEAFVSDSIGCIGRFVLFEGGCR
jgi:hypothetical protein